jgi:4-hydroxy-3-methylbut-2-enyl diphosphate reductase
MRILLASPRGFCAGVNMAIESLELALERFGTPVYVFHEIVHNKWVVSHFCRRGVVFVNHLSEVPPGSKVLYSAHGVSPEVRRQASQRSLDAFDATCPLVTKVHREAIRFSEEGYTIVLIGHAGHDEVIGTMGEAARSMVLVENADDVDRLEIRNPDKLAYLTQTTLSVDDASQIIGRLRQRFPHIVGPAKDDICYATQNRQEAVRLLAEEADVALVVGSQNSSNSRRLAELAGSSGIPSHLIDGPGDISPEWFSGDETVLITAGASAPESVVAECLEWLTSRFGATVELRTVRREEVRFALPKELRDS